MVKALVRLLQKPFYYLFKGIILFYRYAISPVIPARCRFDPTCSGYALQALERFGAFKGGYLALKRFLKCHPWGPHGYDPVPMEDDKNS